MTQGGAWRDGLEHWFYSGGGRVLWDRLCGPQEKFLIPSSELSLKDQDPESRLHAGRELWAEPQGPSSPGEAPGHSSESRIRFQGTPRCWLREHWTPPCGV